MYVHICRKLVYAYMYTHVNAKLAFQHVVGSLQVREGPISKLLLFHSKVLSK